MLRLFIAGWTCEGNALMTTVYAGRVESAKVMQMPCCSVTIMESTERLYRADR